MHVTSLYLVIIIFGSFSLSKGRTVIYDPAPSLVSILILNLALRVGCLLKEASDSNIDCPQLPLFSSVNPCQPSSMFHMTETGKMAMFGAEARVQ